MGCGSWEGSTTFTWLILGLAFLVGCVRVGMRKKGPSPGVFGEGPFFCFFEVLASAVTYSPTPSRVQYHQRDWA